MVWVCFGCECQDHLKCVFMWIGVDQKKNQANHRHNNVQVMDMTMASDITYILLALDTMNLAAIATQHNIKPDVTNRTQQQQPLQLTTSHHTRYKVVDFKKHSTHTPNHWATFWLYLSVKKLIMLNLEPMIKFCGNSSRLRLPI